MQNKTQVIKVAPIYPDAKIPAYQSKEAACFDISAYLRPEQRTQLPDGTQGLVIPPGGIADVGTGLKFEIGRGWRLDVHSRSGTWFKNRVRAAAQGRGTIDSDFRDEVKVSVENRSGVPFVIRHGDRIAQGELNEVTPVEFIVVAEADLSTTERGLGGFGSTGMQ